jgi:hypothetical protein
VAAALYQTRYNKGLKHLFPHIRIKKSIQNQTNRLKIEHKIYNKVQAASNSVQHGLGMAVPYPMHLFLKKIKKSSIPMYS